MQTAFADAGLFQFREDSLKKPRVVIADDSSRILVAIKTILSPQFDIVDCVLNGEQAVEAVMHLQPDLVVLDIMMPQLDGIQAARHLQKLGSNAKIVFLTGIQDPEYIRAALDMEGNGFVFKSRMNRDLIPAITTVLEGRTFCSNNYTADAGHKAESTPKGEPLES
jgi:two-component system, NarL family, response regulator